MNEQSLIARLDRLERKCKRLILAAGALALVLVAAITTAAVQEQEVPDVVQARKIEVVDQKGKPRVILSVMPAGPVLYVTGENGKPRAMLRAFEDGPSLRLGDANGEIRASLNVSTIPSLRLDDEQGGNRANLFVGPDGRPVLKLSGPDGEVLTKLPPD